MAETQLAERVDTLENYMKELSYQSLKTGMEIFSLSQEMKAFKEEMKAFKEEMKAFKNEMRAFKEESRRDRREMNIKWGELANKMGTFAEDIVAPNLPRVARELFSCDAPELFGVRIKKKSGSRIKEYDVLVVCKDHVLINESKSTLGSRDVDEMISCLGTFREFFPEYQDRKLVGVVASLYVDESIIRYAGSKGILVMGMGEETMEVFNSDVVKTY